MSARKPRKAGELVYRKPKPELRLVKNPDERPRPAPDPGLKEVLGDMRRRHHRVQDGRMGRGPEGKDAA